MALMKTTIDLPEALYRRLKVRAAQSGVTIRELVVHGIERELAGEADRQSAVSRQQAEQERHSYIDEKGWPVLKRPTGEQTVVTNEFVNRLREEEGV